MKRYTVSQARERLAEVLDEAERGGTAVIERRDVQYVITAKRPRARPRATAPVIELIDAALDRGEWSWTWSPDGVGFQGRRSGS